MSQSRGFGLNGKSIYGNVAKPMFVDLNFTVDRTNGNGLGIRSLKSNGYVRNVFMNTSATPGANDGYTNPNPAAGFILIQLKNNFNYALAGFSSLVSPVVNPTTSTTSGLTAGQAYVITVLGTTTLAEWQSIGLPAGLTPTVGQSFIATATGTGGSHTGKVGTPSASGITSIETVGDPNQSISNASVASNGGAWLLLQCLAPTVTSVTNAFEAPMIPTAPAAGTVVGMQLRFDGSTVSIPDSPGSSGI